MNRFCLVVICLLAASNVFAQQYLVTPLAPLTDGGGSTAYAINTAGHVTGASNGHAAVWRDGTVQELGILSGAVACVGKGINDADQVVGFCTDSANGSQAFLWTTDGGLTALPVPAPSAANAINTQGEIVGWYSPDGSQRRAFIYRDGALQDLTDQTSNALAISDLDQIVGWTWISGFRRPVLWDGDGQRDLGTPDGSGDGWANAISSDGLAAGSASTGECPGYGSEDAVVWTPYGIANLGNLGPSDCYSSVPKGEAFGISGNIVVGGSWVETVSGTTTYGELHAFVYDLNGPGSLVDLNSGVDAGLTLIEATAINGAGQIVVFGRAPDTNKIQSVLLTPVPSQPD